jgi:replicative DNA helicase
MIEYGDWKSHIYPAADRLTKAPILIDDSAAPNILELRAKARRFRGNPKYFPASQGNRPPLGLMVIDYLQLARGLGGKREDSREREIADISRGLKALAKDLHIPVIAVSQLNRGLERREDKRPQLSDLRESGAIEQDADMIVFIHREEMYGTEGAERGKAELIIGKNRHGPTESVSMTFLREFTKFTNYAGEEDHDR